MFFVLFFHGHFITGGVISPPSEVRLKTAPDFKVITPGGHQHPQHAPAWIPVPAWKQLLRPIKAVGRLSLRPRPPVPAAAAPRTRITCFFPGSPRCTGTPTVLAVGQAPTIPTAAPESPATSTATSGETMLPGEREPRVAGQGRGSPLHGAPEEKGRARLALKALDFEIPEFGGGPHRKRYIPHPLIEFKFN